MVVQVMLLQSLTTQHVVYLFTINFMHNSCFVPPNLSQVRLISEGVACPCHRELPSELPHEEQSERGETAERSSLQWVFVRRVIVTLENCSETCLRPQLIYTPKAIINGRLCSGLQLWEEKKGRKLIVIVLVLWERKGVVLLLQEEDNRGGRLQGRLHFTTVADVVLSPHRHKAQNLWCMQHRIRTSTRTPKS